MKFVANTFNNRFLSTIDSLLQPYVGLYRKAFNAYVTLLSGAGVAPAIQGIAIKELDPLTCTFPTFLHCAHPTAICSFTSYPEND